MRQKVAMAILLQTALKLAKQEHGFCVKNVVCVKHVFFLVKQGFMMLYVHMQNRFVKTID